MARVKLKYRSLAEIVDSNGMGIITLTDESEMHAINIICDRAMCEQINLRGKNIDLCKIMLPEVLTAFLGEYFELNLLEITVYDIREGQYLVTLVNKHNFSIRHIRLSDAILFHLIAGIPIYIEERLMNAQSVDFDARSDGSKLSIPINSLDTDKLREELQHAVDDEDYRLASYINDELKKRDNKDTDNR